MFGPQGAHMCRNGRLAGQPNPSCPTRGDPTDGSATVRLHSVFKPFGECPSWVGSKVDITESGKSANVSQGDESMRRYGIPLAIGLTALVGVVNLPLPFFGDQALFTVMASMMSEGSVLYVDVWDVKQPAIYLFYLVAGEGFGYSEVGLHTFEILYWLSLAGILAITLRTVLASRLAIVASIFLTIGTYFMVVRPYEMGMVEGLANLPIYLAMWFAYSVYGRGARLRFRPAAFGFFAGLVLMFKLLFFPVVVGFWMVALMELGRESRSTRILAAATGWVAAGLALPLIPTVAYFALQGGLDELVWTTFIYPWQAVAVPGATKSLLTLARSVWWFGWSFLPVCLLALLGLWRVVRHGRTRFDNLALVWLILGSVVILIQRSSWWTWHFLLLIVPLGLFAGRGVDWITEKWVSLRVTYKALLPLAVAAAMIPALYAMAAKTVPLVTNDLALTQHGRIQYEAAVWPIYDEVRHDGAFLDQANAATGPIYLFGDPTYNYLFDRDQAVPINGWSPQYWGDGLWNRVNEDLVRERPPYIQVAGWARELMDERHEPTADFLETEYGVLSRSSSGVWYQRR